MLRPECKFCLYFNKFYKIKNFELIEIEKGECQLNISTKCKENCSLFILADKFRGERINSIIPLLEGINKSLLAIKYAIDNSALAEKYDKELNNSKKK